MISNVRSTCLAASILLAGAISPAQQQQQPQIDWQKGPTIGNLGGLAEVKVPEGFLFTDKRGAQRILELTHNLPTGDEAGALVPSAEEQNWFIIVEFTEIGFVKDDEKTKLDSAALLKSITNATEEANRVRAERGWPGFHVTGWEREPHYDPRTHNLTWAIRGRNDSGGQSVNHSVRILGRRGTMNIDLVMAPEEYVGVLPTFDGILEGVTFRQGNRYADFVAGDKVASYGLTALIAGGAGAVALKTGLLAKAWKLIVVILLAAKKVIIIVIVAIGAALRQLWKWLINRKSTHTQIEALPTPEQQSEKANPTSVSEE